MTSGGREGAFLPIFPEQGVLSPNGIGGTDDNQHSNHVSLLIEGIRVLFPFQPYGVQVDYMASVLKALQGGHNALLESPTGTGKTMSLLCSSLAYMQSRDVGTFFQRAQNVRKRIVYTSRTHAQLAQVIREFKRTAYAGMFQMAILGSRDHLCVNTSVSNLPNSHAVNSQCNRLRADKQCRFFNGVANFMNAEQSGKVFQQGSVGLFDIEDLCAKGKQEVFCPYYYERELGKDADIIFCPYSYILDASLHKQLPFELNDCIVIFDEGHNIPSVLSSAATMNLTSLDLAHSIAESGMAVAMVQTMQKETETGEQVDDAGGGKVGELGSYDEAVDYFAQLKIILCQLETLIDQFEIPKEGNGELVLPGTDIFSLLARINITHETVLRTQPVNLMKVLTSAVQVMNTADGGCPGLNKLQQFLSGVFVEDAELIPEEMLVEAYRTVIISKRVGRTNYNASMKWGGNTSSESRTLGFWCLDIAATLQTAIAGVSSIIITSGTLSPMDHFAAELGVPFTIVHEGQHVVKPDQVYGAVLCQGPDEFRLNSSYSMRDSPAYRNSLGEGILNLGRNVPGGVLVFFPSYVTMNAAIEQWKIGNGSSSGGNGAEVVTVWAKMSNIKPVFVEPRDNAELNTVVQAFQTEADRVGGSGAFFLAVCRGKVSEGVDFADRHGRCVILTGIPFANRTDLLVRLKQEYITRTAPRRPRVKGRLFTGDDWYKNEAIRAVNQCIGRVVRHKDDYGAIILADERFITNMDGISSWVKRSLASHPTFPPVYGEITRFFIGKRKTHPDPPRRSHDNTGDALSTDSNGVGGLPGGARMISDKPVGAEEAKTFAAKKLEAFYKEKDERERLWSRTGGGVAGSVEIPQATSGTSHNQPVSSGSAVIQGSSGGGFKKMALPPATTRFKPPQQSPLPKEKTKQHPSSQNIGQGVNSNLQSVPEKLQGDGGGRVGSVASNSTVVGEEGSKHDGRNSRSMQFATRLRNRLRVPPPQQQQASSSESIGVKAYKVFKKVMISLLQLKEKMLCVDPSKETVEVAKAREAQMKQTVCDGISQLKNALVPALSALPVVSPTSGVADTLQEEEEEEEEEVNPMDPNEECYAWMKELGEFVYGGFQVYFLHHVDKAFSKNVKKRNREVTR